MSPRTLRAAAARPVSTASSHERDAPAFDEIVDAAAPGQVQFFQLSVPLSSVRRSELKGYPRYVNKDRNITKRIVQHAEKRGIKALFITVDAPQLGRREKVCMPATSPSRTEY